METAGQPGSENTKVGSASAGETGREETQPSQGSGEAFQEEGWSRALKGEETFARARWREASGKGSRWRGQFTRGWRQRPIQGS